MNTNLMGLRFIRSFQNVTNFPVLQLSQNTAASRTKTLIFLWLMTHVLSQRMLSINQRWRITSTCFENLAPFDGQELNHMEIHILGSEVRRKLRYKANSALNAVKHGAFAKTKILPHEDIREHQRLTRLIYKDLRPRGIVEESLVDQMIESLWTAERLKLRVLLKQENIFAQLTPIMLAQMIGVPEEYLPFAPDYLKEPNTRFLKKDLKLPERHYQLYLHLCQHSKGVQNYQMVFGTYKDLFQGVHDFIGDSYKVPFLMPTGAGLEIGWQKNAKAVEEALLKYAASLYYMIHFDELRPHIRLWTSSWYFLDRMNRKESDYQDDLVIKELNRYRSLLHDFMKFRKSQIDNITMNVTQSLKDSNLERNEITVSEAESTT